MTTNGHYGEVKIIKDTHVPQGEAFLIETSARPWAAPAPDERKNFDGYPFNYAKALAAARLLRAPRERRIEWTKQWLLSLHCTLWHSWIITERKGLDAAAEFIVDLTEQIQEHWLDRENGPQ